MEDLQPLLFVDTNAIHYARLFLGFARGRSLPPVGGGSEDPKEEIKQKFIGKTRANYESGRKLVDYLLDRSGRGARIEYSPVTRLELTAGFLRGKALLDAAGEGIAQRMWNRVDEREILDRLSPASFADVASTVGGLEADFDAAGIQLVEADPKKMSEVWSLASQLLGITFLDLGDCIIYASSLLVEANELVTADSYFREVASYMENPDSAKPHQREYFRDANGKMKNVLATAIGVGADDIILPKAPKNW